ncbi:MAG: nuclear transport factor 2 family protein [Pseudomonadota bacterium]
MTRHRLPIATRWLQALVSVAVVATSGAAWAANPADDAAIARGRAAVAWLNGFACPRPGAPLTTPGLESDASALRIQAENLAFLRNQVTVRAEALRAREVIAREFAPGSRPTASMQKAFESLDGALSASDHRAANALVQWSLAGYAQVARTPPDYDILSDAPHPLAPFARAISDIRPLARQFGDPAPGVPARFESCLVEINDSYLELAAPLIRERASRAKRAADLEPLLQKLSVFPILPNQPGGEVYTELRARQSQLAADEERARALAKARADQAERDRLTASASRALGVARRYVQAIDAGQIDAAANLLAEDIFLYSPKGNARGRSAVSARMREAASRAAGARLLTPELTSDFRVVSRIYSDRGSGTMTFQVVADRIARIELSQ